MRCGLIGPGRTRNGLGPFLARFLERAGVSVVAAAGRDGERTAAACEALEKEVGHAVRPHASIDALLGAESLDCLVIAAPPPAHLPALRAAVAAGLPTLCEKPLVGIEDAAAVPGLLEEFAAKEVLLVENCQWPETLEAYDALWPGRDVVSSVAMRLSPVGCGREMIEDSLSHFLSLAQAVGGLGSGTQVLDAGYEGAAPDTEDCVLDVEFVTGERVVGGRFELKREERQPRPAWIEIDGRRADRKVRTEDYAMRFEAPDGRSVDVADPLERLVYRFASALRDPARDLIRTEAERIGVRARLYEELVRRWPS